MRRMVHPLWFIATPLEIDQFDNDAKITYLEDIGHILHICRDSNMVIDPVSTREVQTALKKSKSNNAADCMDITCEHLTFRGTPVREGHLDGILVQF